MVWPFSSKDSPKDEPDKTDNKRKLNDQDEAPAETAGGIGQARLSRLNTGETYKLTISNVLSAKIIGGQVGSFQVTGETVMIQDLDDMVIFSGELGDFITVWDDNGRSTAVAEVGAGSRTESRVEIRNAKMLETNYKLRRGAPQVIVENCPVMSTQGVQIEVAAHTGLPVVMEMNANKAVQNVIPSPGIVDAGTVFNGNGLLGGNEGKRTQELLQGRLMGYQANNQQTLNQKALNQEDLDQQALELERKAQALVHRQAMERQALEEQAQELERKTLEQQALDKQALDKQSQDMHAQFLNAYNSLTVGSQGSLSGKEDDPNVVCE